MLTKRGNTHKTQSGHQRPGTDRQGCIEDYPGRARAGAINFLPTSMGVAQATTKVLPAYKGKFEGISIRAPIPIGSIADLSMIQVVEGDLVKILS